MPYRYELRGGGRGLENNREIEEKSEEENGDGFKNLTDYFYYLLPLAITYGMSVKEFWEDDPDLFWAYRFSYYENLKYNQELFNQQAWLQGAYFHEAVSVALCNAFSKSKHTYSDKPYDLYSKEKTQEEMSQELQAKITSRITQVQNLFKNKKL